MYCLLHPGWLPQGGVAIQGDLSTVLGTDPRPLPGHLASGKDDGALLHAPSEGGFTILVGVPDGQVTGDADLEAIRRELARRSQAK